MNIVVCVKQVPDTWADKRLRDSDHTLDRDGVDVVMNEIDEYAVEEGLRLKEAHGGEVTILTMGPPRAAETIRKALSMGADKAVHVVDDALHGSCGPATSLVLAKALGTLEFDVVICGSESTDARLGVMAALLAERLALPQLSLARKVTAEDGRIRIERQTETGYEVVEAATPAVVSVVEKINEPRYPSFKGIMAAKSKPLTTLGVSDLALDAGDIGLEHATSTVVDVTPRPPRGTGTIVDDDGSGGTRLAEFLVAQKLI